MLAETLHRDEAQPVGVTVGELMTHAYLLGPSGTGKTSLLTRLACELAAQTGTPDQHPSAGGGQGCEGNSGARDAVAPADRPPGLLLLDPHGDLVRQVLLRLPDAQLSRVRLFYLGDTGNLPTLNPLWIAPTDDPAALAIARSVRSAAVTALFADLWGLHRAATPNLLHFLEAALSALIHAGDGCLAQLPRFLTDPGFRADVVHRAADPRVTARWREFAALSPEDRSRTVRAILNKAAEFDRNPLLATIFGDPGPGLRLDEHMDAGTLLLIDLPRGLVPEGTVELVGSLIVALAYQAALAREARDPHDRRPVVAVIDEFQEFALSTFAKALTATRKYGLGFVVANQNLSRVGAVSTDVLATLLANAATLVALRTSPVDAETVAPYFTPFDATDLMAQKPFHGYWRLPGRHNETGTVTAARSLPPTPPVRSPDEVTALLPALRLPGRPLEGTT